MSPVTGGSTRFYDLILNEDGSVGIPSIYSRSALHGIGEKDGAREHPFCFSPSVVMCQLKPLAMKMIII